MQYMTYQDASGEVRIANVDDEGADTMSALMHENFGRCGGFMVHDTLAEAEAARRESLAPPARPAMDYTLDREHVVTALLPAVDDERILETIAALSSMKNRYYLSDEGANASLWLKDRWEGLAKQAGRSDVKVELFDQGYPQKSVIMTIPGTTKASEVIVIGGHLDSIALGGRSADAPGADDDASGTATVTEIARVLLESGYRPERTIQFMAYAAEEVGLRGSQAIARDYKKRGVNVVGALQLDMTNYQGSDDADVWLIEDFTSAAQNEFLRALMRHYLPEVVFASDRCGYACSDHASWHRQGVPASMPFEARSKQMNKSIHTRNDTLERSDNNAAHALKFARLGVAYAVEMGKGDADRREEGDDVGLRWLALLLAAGTFVAYRRVT